MSVALRAENLAKRYRGPGGPRYQTLRDVLSRPWQRSAPDDARWFWALKDVSFEVEAGQVVGVIGGNGAGKTTLLRVLARVTRPTEGRAEVRGRLGSLLDVGTGFHPELTGRENVFLSGAILGMRRREIARRFDEIAAFSGVERFLDLPLKHFSAGMQVRLAFAVAAHLEPDVLLVDEVLAVGDLEFQRRCLGRMDETVRSGRTVVLVSHQLGQVRRLCARALWIDAGRVRMDGPTAEVLAAYETSVLAAGRSEGLRGATGFTGWQVRGAEGETGHAVVRRGPLGLAFDVELAAPVRGGEYGITLYDGDRRIAWSVSHGGLDLAAGRYRLVHDLPDLPLRPGVYAFEVGFHDGLAWHVWAAVPHLVVSTPALSTHRLDQYAGLLNLAATFSVEPVSAST